MPSRCRRVDLPAPEGPMMETNSPSLTSALMRRNTKVLVGPCSKYFSTFRRTIIGELIRYLYYDAAACKRARLSSAFRAATVRERLAKDRGKIRQNLPGNRAAVDVDGRSDA